MKTLAIGVCALLAAAGAWAEDEPLRPGVPVEIFVSPGRATTVLFHTGRKVAAISLASPVLRYKYDKALNQLELTPAVRTAGIETNLNLRVGSDVYVLLVKVVNDVRAQYLRVFSLAGEPPPDEEEALGRAPPLKPADIDLVGAARALERAEADPVFRAARPNLRIDALDRTYAWNGCLVMLSAVAQFLDSDLLVFRVRWVNRTRDALYLDLTQYGLFAGSTPIPVIARYKEGTGPMVWPGEMETVYLAVQGYRLSRRNDWRLGLPPDAGALSRIGVGGPAP